MSNQTPPPLAAPDDQGREWAGDGCFSPCYVLPVPLGHGVGAALLRRGALPGGGGQRGLLPLLVALVFLVFWTFLQHGFHLLLDWLPENLFAFVTGLVGAGALHFLVVLHPPAGGKPQPHAATRSSSPWPPPPPR